MLPSPEPVPPSIAPTGTVGYTSSGQDQDLAQAEIAPASDTAPADGHVPSMRRSNTARMWTDSPDKQVRVEYGADGQFGSSQEPSLMNVLQHHVVAEMLA